MYVQCNNADLREPKYMSNWVSHFKSFLTVTERELIPNLTIFGGIKGIFVYSCVVLEGTVIRKQNSEVRSCGLTLSAQNSRHISEGAEEMC